MEDVSISLSALHIPKCVRVCVCVCERLEIMKMLDGRKKLSHRSLFYF